MTLQENMTYRFNCQSDGWDSHAPLLLTWYLNGERQGDPSTVHGRLVMTTQENSEVMRRVTNQTSTFSLRARKWDRELVCIASNPKTGEGYNATITLNVQCESRWTISLVQDHSISNSFLLKWTNSEYSAIIFLSFVSQLSQRSLGWMPITVKPRTLGSPWSSLLWYGPTHLPPSPSWTSLASCWPTPLTFSYWTHECTPGWPITLWGLCSVAYQGMFRWTPATVWERYRVTSHWQVRKANSYWCYDH